MSPKYTYELVLRFKADEAEEVEQFFALHPELLRMQTFKQFVMLNIRYHRQGQGEQA